MAFTKVLLTILAGIVVTAYIAQSSTCPFFEERNGKAIVKNQPLVYVCSIKSSSSVPAIIWNGSSFADCPGERIIQIGPGSSLDEYCGSFSANASTIGDCYTSVLSLTALPELNGTVVQCTDNDERVKVGSATIIIDDDPINLKSCPIYNDVGELHKIECSWSNFLKQSIEECYMITYTSDYNSHAARSAQVCTSPCSEASCYDTYVHTVDPNTEECIVKVETLGPDVFIATESVSTANLFISIHVDNYCGGPNPCVARCKFLSRIEDEVYCMVDFTGPDGVTHTSVSTERGSAGDGVTVELMLSNGLPLPPLTVYLYQATTVDINRNISCSRVNSAFETGYYDYGNCTLADLGNSQENIYTASVCVEGETPLFINGGTVCYTGTTPGSTAVYHCGEGYEASRESEVIICQHDGVWKSPMTCTRQNDLESQYKYSLIATGSFVVILLCVIAGLVLVIICFFRKYRNKPEQAKDSIPQETSIQMTGFTETQYPIKETQGHQSNEGSSEILGHQPNEGSSETLGQQPNASTQVTPKSYKTVSSSKTPGQLLQNGCGNAG